MEKVKMSLLFKSRGYGACIKAGYNLYTDNFKKLFSSTWILVLIISFVEGLNRAIDMSTAGSTQLYTFIIGIIIEVGFAIILFGTIYYILNQHAETDVFTRTTFKNNSKYISAFSLRVIKTIVWEIILSVPFIAIYIFFLKTMAGFSLSDPSVHKYMIIIFFAIIIAFILYMPFGYLMMKYNVGEKIHSLTLIRKEYRIGFKHWGFIFAVALITVIVTMIAVLVVNMPQIIISSAQRISVMGVLQGDPSGLPSYFGFMVFAVSLITTFIAIFVEMAMIFPIYYMYGSIVTQEIEKADFDKNI